MYYTAMHLPIDEPWYDGCTIMNSSGEVVNWKEDREDLKNNPGWRRARLFLVSNHFNEQRIVGEPSPLSMNWLKPGMQVPIANCEPWIWDNYNKKFADKIPGPHETAEVGYRLIVPITDRHILQLVWRMKCHTCRHLH